MRCRPLDQLTKTSPQQRSDSRLNFQRPTPSPCPLLTGEGSRAVFASSLRAFPRLPVVARHDGGAENEKAGVTAGLFQFSTARLLRQWLSRSLGLGAQHALDRLDNRSERSRIVDGHGRQGLAVQPMPRLDQPSMLTE